MSISEKAQKLCETEEFGEWLRERYGNTIEYALTQFQAVVLDAAARMKILLMFCEAACPGELDTTPVCIRRCMAIFEAYEKGKKSDPAHVL